MYQVSVPLVQFSGYPEESIAEARRLGATRVFLCPADPTAPKEVRDASIAAMKRVIPLYKAAGLEVGSWICTMGHGGPLAETGELEKCAFTPVTGLHGVTSSWGYCPSDDRFVKAVCSYLRDLAGTGVTIMMLDDDFRFSHRGDCGCICKNHMAEYARRLGEEIAPGDVLNKAFAGGYNRYRQVYYDMLGDTLRDFCRKMRAAIDEVNPDIRFSFAAVTSSWDCDGADAIELSKIMAGKNRPFLRLIGAPYWSALNNSRSSHVQHTAELERMQAKWCEDEDIEIFSEGDAHPRPRYIVPAAYLETFDTILRADGRLDGILKYGIDYCSSPLYETGYADKAERNRPLYAELEKRFAGKRAVGVNVTAERKKFLHTDFSEPRRKIDWTWDGAFYQTEQYLTCNCSIPTTYDASPVTVAFGENAKYIKNPGKGFIIDAIAAKNLEALGVDTGIASIDAQTTWPVSRENFFAVGNERAETIVNDATPGAVRMTLKPGATVLSVMPSRDPEGQPVDLPSCVKYENAAGQRFLIFGYDFDGVRNMNAAFTRNYTRQTQVIREYEWLAGEKLPAVCRKHPDLYIMAKRSDTSMAVGLWNAFPDSVAGAVIELDRPYARVEFVGCAGCVECTGRLDGDRVILDGEIPAFGFAGFEVFD